MDSQLRPLDPVDISFFMSTRSLLKEYLENVTSNHPIIIEFKKDLPSGQAETLPFFLHKGEVELKVVLRTWGKHFRVDVYQNVRFLLFFQKWVRETHWSSLTEKNVQTYLDIRLAQP